MKLPKVALFVLLSLLIASACQQIGESGAKSPDFKLDYEQYQLDNGLDVILHQDDSDPIVSVAILFHVGSNREKPGRTGFAHFFEHMLFQNSENVGKGNFFKTIEDLGGTFNGGTSNDFTIYFETLPKDALERILWMESDRMGFLINTVTTPVLENEKQVVKNEKRQRVDNQPYGHNSYVVDKALYPEEHPYNWQVIGSLEDLQAATIDDVKEFYDKFYGPNNATMVIAGDIDFEETKGMVEKYFGEIPAKEEVGVMEPNIPQLEASRMLMHEDNFAQVPQIQMVWPVVEQFHPDQYPLDILAQILSNGKRAPFYKVIVEDQKLAPSVRINNGSSEIAGEFTLTVRTNPNVDLDDVNAAIQTAFQKFEEEGIDDKDMMRIKNAQERGFYNNISSVFLKSFQLALFNEYAGSPDELMKEVDRILAVTKEDVMRVYEKYIKGKPFIMTSFVPKGMPELAVEGSETADVVEEEIVAGAEAPPMEETEGTFEKTPSSIDRSTPPALGETPVVTLPEIWNASLGNGLQVYGIQNEELPLVNFSLRLKGGMLMDDPNKIGVANLITDVMMEGTANKTPEELEDAIGQLGATINMSTAAEYITVSGNCLVRNFDDVFDLMEEILLEPRWDETEFDRLKTSTLTQIKQQAGQPGTTASLVFNKLVYGEDNLLANSTFGTEESVQAISLDDLKAFYEKNFSPSISSFHLTGAVSQKQAMEALASLEDNWAAKEVVIPAMPKPEPVAQPQIYFVDIPNAKQSELRVGCPSLERNNEDYTALSFVNEKFGGGTTARLFSILREEKGYTYGAYSGLPSRMNASAFSVRTGVRSNVTKESVEIIKDLLQQYSENYSEEDLESTRTSSIRQNALAYETLSNKLGILQNISTYELPMNYLDKEQEVIKNMTLEQAKGTIQKYMAPGNMVYLVVGDAATQADRLKGLGLGDPVMLDREGVMVKVVPN